MTSRRKLAAYVHVVELGAEGGPTGRSGIFGPADDLPDWAEAAISNPKVWAAGSEPATTVAPAPVQPVVETPPAAPAVTGVPARSGAGSSTAMWAAYAAANNVAVDDGAGRADIIAALAAAGVAVE